MIGEDWRLDDDGGLDDIVVPDVQTFRMERMDVNAWWIALYFADGRVEHINLVADQTGIVARRETDPAP